MELEVKENLAKQKLTKHSKGDLSNLLDFEKSLSAHYPVFHALSLF